MARSKIKELVVEIVGDDKKLQQASGQASAAIKRIGASAARMGAALGAAGVAAGAGLAAVVGKAVATADAAGKTAASIGVTVEELTALRHAADLSGVSNEQFEGGLKRMARTSSDAANGLSTAQRSFRQLGIAVTDNDGKLRSQQDILGDVAEEFSRMDDGTRKTALAQEIFGRAGADLIPMLNQGRKGLAEMTGEAERLGLVIDTETATAAAEFQDNLTRLRATAVGMSNRLAQQMLPILVDLSERFVQFADDLAGSDGVQVALEGVEFAFRVVLSTASVLKNTIVGITETLATLAAAAQLAAKGEFRAAWEAIKIGAVDATERVAQTGSELKTIWTGLGELVREESATAAAGVAPLVAQNQQLETSAERAARLLREQAAALQELRGVAGGSLAATVVPEIRMPDMISPTEGLQMYRAEVAGAIGETEELASVGDEMQSIALRGIDAFADFASGAGDAIKQFVNQAIGDLTRLLFHRAFSSILSAVFPGAGLASSVLPSFASGGIVPGPLGAPQLVVAHGGETVLPAGGGGGVLRIEASMRPGTMPPLQAPMTPTEAARDVWWRRFYSELTYDHADRGGRFPA